MEKPKESPKRSVRDDQSWNDTDDKKQAPAHSDNALLKCLLRQQSRVIVYYLGLKPSVNILNPHSEPTGGCWGSGGAEELAALALTGRGEKWEIVAAYRVPNWVWRMGTAVQLDLTAWRARSHAELVSNQCFVEAPGSASRWRRDTFVVKDWHTRFGCTSNVKSSVSIIWMGLSDHVAQYFQKAKKGQGLSGGHLRSFL